MTRSPRAPPATPSRGPHVRAASSRSRRVDASRASCGHPPSKPPPPVAIRPRSRPPRAISPVAPMPIAVAPSMSCKSSRRVPSCSPRSNAGSSRHRAPHRRPPSPRSPPSIHGCTDSAPVTSPRSSRPSSRSVAPPCSPRSRVPHSPLSPPAHLAAPSPATSSASATPATPCSSSSPARSSRPVPTPPIAVSKPAPSSARLAVLTHSPRAATVTAAAPDTEVLAIDRSVFATAARRAPELVLGLSATLAGWLAPNRPDVL